MQCVLWEWRLSRRRNRKWIRGGRCHHMTDLSSGRTKMDRSGRAPFSRPAEEARRLRCVRITPCNWIRGLVVRWLVLILQFSRYTFWTSSKGSPQLLIFTCMLVIHQPDCSMEMGGCCINPDVWGLPWGRQWCRSCTWHRPSRPA